jgi:hypothetical protein
MKKLTVEDLNRLHSEAKSQDKECYSEYRSNILLIASEHYSRRLTDWWSRSRTSGSQTQDSQKLRITKNWLHRYHRLYVTSIMNKAPTTTISPRNQTELKDQKSSELNESVWQYAKDKYRFKKITRDFCSDYCGIGEAMCIVKYDPSRGYIKGYEQKTDEEGNLLVDEEGSPLANEDKPIMSGEFVFERVYAHNIFRDPNAKSLDDCMWIGVEKMESTKTLKEIYEGDEEKSKYIVESNEEFIIFDTAKGGYSKESNQTMVMEKYCKPSQKYPNGYYYIWTKAGILEEGELPFGIWPIAWVGFDEYQTKVRANSFVKVARPWIAEINRASSQRATQQVTLGDDKLLYQSGSKLSQGHLLPGVRGISYTGEQPIVMPGRSGDQFANYIQENIAEVERALMIDLLDNEKVTALDPTALLFRSMSQSEKFQIYADKFGEFLVKITEIFLELAREYLPDDEVIAAAGRSEAINIAEFRTTEPLNYIIKVEEQNDTIETKLGRHLISQQVMQYAGNQLSREDIGKLMINMPFGNWKEIFSEFTQDYNNIKNDFLAIERGEVPYVSQNDNSEYCLKQVAKRKKERDYQLLPEYVRALYDQYEQMHMQKTKEEQEAAQLLKNENIPTGGALVACDLYIPNEDPSKTPKRARIPYQALDWLVKTLETQGMTLKKMEEMNQGQLKEIAGLINSGAMQSPQGIANTGEAIPEGIMQ